MRFTLISHALCPYVQRAAIVLAEKGVPFTRRDVDLSDKPGWFTAVSPLGRTPVLLVQDVPVFESAVICEYLDETLAPRLHPPDALQRASERAWMEFGSAILGTIAAYYNAQDGAALELRRDELRARMARVEARLDLSGPFFAGSRFGMVDAVFAPVFRYFEVFEALGEASILAALPKVRAWRAALAARPSVRAAAAADYPQRLRRFLIERGSELSRRVARHEAAQATGLRASVK